MRNSVGNTSGQDTRFSSSVSADVKRSVFARSQIHKTSFNPGKLIPIYIDEVLPGDTFDLDLSYITRLTTPITPTMDNLELDFYFFFVPNRIVWDGWEKLNGQSNSSAWAPATMPNPVPTLELTVAGAPGGVVQSGDILDYYGLPVGYTPYEVSCLPYRGYVSIWNRWFRDINLQAPQALIVGDASTSLNQGADSTKPFPVAKFHDYFTSCLPQVLRPLISGAGSTTPAPFWLQSSNLFPQTTATLWDDVTKTTTLPGVITPAAMNFVQVLRNAFQLNKLLERDARGGSRYIEMLKAHFGVQADDYRLQYPEYLGHHHGAVGVNQVPQTSSTDATTPQGNLAAYAMAAERGVCKVKKSFVEHGFVHGFVVARQRKTYQQGIERMWTRRRRFDYYYPELANITEQPVYTREIMYSNVEGDHNKIFGFQEPWAEYRYKPSRVSGQLRSGVAASLDVWHYADYYSVVPVLSAAWIQDNSLNNIKRTLAVDPDVQDAIVADIRIGNLSSRPMPVRSIPGLADHF